MTVSILSSCSLLGGTSGGAGDSGNGQSGGTENTPNTPSEPDTPKDDETPGEDNTPDDDIADVDFENRFDALEGTLSSEAIAQVKRLYSLYDDSVYEWLANLWDDEIGGFYYANSSRDYEGFLPDIETTRQVLAIIRTSGMVSAYGENEDEAFVSVFPKEFADKIVAFVKSCQDPDDGYFYHPQWGKNIGSSRKARDLDQAITLINLFGAEFDYPTALDRLSGAGATASLSKSRAKAVSSVVSATDSSLPYYLQSAEGLIKYLDTFNFKADSHNTGHTVASLSSQLKAAGLIDVACDYFDALQEEIYQEQVAAGEKPTGLWQDVVNYTSLSGLYKIGGLYETANRTINYLDECVESAMECIVQDIDCSVVIYVYNPWAGLSMAIRSMKRSVSFGESKYDLQATYDKVREAYPELIKATVDKLLVFQKDSGGFSYNRTTSAPRTQGVSASLGLCEGDVNATNIAVNSISGHIFISGGLTRPAIWNEEDFDNFIATMQGLDPINKIKLETTDLSFEDCEIGTLPHMISSDSGMSGVQYDPLDDSNHAIRIDSPKGMGTREYINVNSTDSFSCIILETDILLTDTQDGNTHQIKLRGSGGNMYMFVLKMNNSSGKVTLTDWSHHTNGIVGDLSVQLEADMWNRIRFEIYTGVDHELAKNGFIVKLFVNDEFAGYSTNYFGPTKSTSDVEPTIGFTNIEIYGMAAVESSLWLDNIYFEMLPMQDFVEEN